MLREGLGSLRPLTIGCSVSHPRPSQCWVCRKPLPKRRRKYCSDACSKTYSDNHYWSYARFAAAKRDKYTCQKCGAKGGRAGGKAKLEVNHITPRRGQGYGAGCHHHLANLETLCHPCHVQVTNRQQAAQRDRFALYLP